MLQLSGSNSISIKRECCSVNNVWLEGLDHVPLVQRRNLLSQRKPNSCSSESGDSDGSKHISLIRPPDGVKEEAAECHLQAEMNMMSQSRFANAHLESRILSLGSGVPVDCDGCNSRGNTLVLSKKITSSEKTCDSVGTCHQNSTLLMPPVDIKVELSDNVQNSSGAMNGADPQFEDPISNDPRDFKLGLDHIVLKERRRMLISRKKGSITGLLMEVPPTNDGEFAEMANMDRSENSEADRKEKINHPRKRKKTATDSVQVALEEDAPGLLQMLVEQGVSVEEIRLYGETSSDESIDPSFFEYSFAELEAVISKLYLQRTALLKFAPMRCSNSSRPRYCVACLFSLIQQIQYLRIRNWPADWGWCRDLHSFIFVFERHNRLVLERPEYGYATYFFELVNFVPVDWQIMRLVTAMKLTSCGRVTLIENRALLVGEDISEGEAEVLMQYGWIRNSGLGTMLGYCDRVVHDRKTEKDSLEWRSKIGKLLTDGFNGGSIVSSDAKKNIIDYVNYSSLETKF